LKIKYSCLAQLVEQVAVNHRVAGSSPAAGAFLCPESMLDAADNKYYVYVLYSEKHDRIYIGQTNNLKIRIAKHNSGKVKSTKSHLPWKLIHSEEFPSRSKAMIRERELKSHKGRDFIKMLSSVGRVRRLPD
jgi:putative endonuclease